MELQFQKIMLDYMKRLAWENKSAEQTLEVKLTDAMPDIGKVLGAWGQPLIRSKEWRGSGMGASGGVMAWVLYAPEEGGDLQCVEAWIPFQMRWDFPQSQRDGSMRISCMLQSMDARTVSARKLMLRCVVSANGEALEPDQTPLYRPETLPEDVQVLYKRYPVRLSAEAGEKSFLLDEQLPLPAACGRAQKLVYYTLQPELVDKKIMADKVVFRGSAVLRGLCMAEDGTLRSFEVEFPFSQYAELDKEYDSNASPDVCIAVTNLELELQEGGMLGLKAGLVGQYVVYDRPTLEVIEDAYSPKRPVVMQLERLCVPAVLDSWQEMLRAEKTLELTGEPADTVFRSGHPQQSRTAQGESLSIPGSFHMLAYDSDGNLQSDSVQWEGTLDVPMPADSSLLAASRVTGKTQAVFSSGTDVHQDVIVDLLAVMETDIPMVTALEIGEHQEPDPDRPSLILRVVGDDSLWEIAKQCGSTVEAIREANGITEEADKDRLLMIPIP